MASDPSASNAERAAEPTGLDDDHHEPGPVSAVALLFLTAVLGGAFAAAVASSFIWLIETATHYLWETLPAEFSVDPFDSWWLFAVPLVGGAMVGLGQRFLGNYPISIDEAITTWRAGGQIEPRTIPASTFNSVASLAFGGPVGFEAALTGIVGGSATLVGQAIGRVRGLVRQALGAEEYAGLPQVSRRLPLWIAAVSGLVVYKAIPFGDLDLGFRFSDFDGQLDTSDALVVAAFAALVVVPVSWAIRLVVLAERATFSRRSPELIGMAGGLAFALLAAVDPLVLFSGQQGLQLLPSVGTPELVYIALANWLALCVALFAGWRGGPIFPIFFSVSAFATAFDRWFDVDERLVIIGGIAAVSVVFVRGSIVPAFFLSLYVAPIAFGGVIVVGCVGAACALAIARPLGLLPAPAASSSAAHPGESLADDHRSGG